ncbi:MAG: glycosyltransferase [Nitrospira sp.]|nr:glycosyltransferase [Nitrospira sp.]MCP9463396.1 glycosyltransferase [Nitrospira sp.]
MTSEALVSVVMPAYKARLFIGDAICSVQVQSYVNWEMLVVDDGSPDKTAELVADLARHDSRIRLIRQRNSGPAMARQQALDAAQGRYIAFLDADDLWLPQKLDRQLAFMRERHAAISFTQFRRISADGTRIGHLVSIPDCLDYRGLLKRTAIATSTVIVDRHLTGDFRMTRTYYDDYALWLSLLRRGFIAHGLQEDLMRYRVVGKSVSRNKWRSAYWVWRVYRDVERLSLAEASWCFANYAVNGVLKYARF